MNSILQTTFAGALRQTEAFAPSAHASPVSSREKAETDNLIRQLRGVPKGALKTVLGRGLGERAWQQARRGAAGVKGDIGDSEVIAGLIRYLSGQAAAELRRAGKHAKFARVTVWRCDGGSASGRARLPWLTQEADEISATAMCLFEGLATSSAWIQSIDLDITTAADIVIEAAPTPFHWLSTPAQAAPA